MTEKEFKEAKRELVSLMENGGHCPESIAAVRFAKDLATLVGVFDDFRPNLTHKRFPPLEWVRRNFSRHLDEVNALGVYIDQRVDIDRPGTVWLFGTCVGEIRSSDVKFRHVIIDGLSDISISTDRWALMHVLVKDSGASVSVRQGGHSKVILKNS